MSGALRVQVARRMDALACLDLRRTVLAEREWFITLPEEFTATVDDEDERIRTLRGDHGLYLVARTATHRVAGLLTAATGPVRRLRHAAKIEVMVAPDARGAGVGGALLEACCAWADAHPVVQKLGLTAFADNGRALALYRSFGFQQEGYRVAEYLMDDGTPRDDVLMYRFCPPPGTPTPLD